jgi:hypothetical protein
MIDSQSKLDNKMVTGSISKELQLKLKNYSPTAKFDCSSNLIYNTY